jgi:hypothetical protein
LVAIAAHAYRDIAPIAAKSSVAKLIGGKISQTFGAKRPIKLFPEGAQIPKKITQQKKSLGNIHLLNSRSPSQPGKIDLFGWAMLLFLVFVSGCFFGAIALAVVAIAMVAD